MNLRIFIMWAYDSTYCVYCQKHLPVTEFVWVEDGKRVGS
jgi:hypothetical protein